VAGVLVAVLLVGLLWPARPKDKALTAEQQMAQRPTGSFPVPPIDLQVPPSPRARRLVAERLPANVGAGPIEDIDGQSTEKEV